MIVPHIIESGILPLEMKSKIAVCIQCLVSLKKTFKNSLVKPSSPGNLLFLLLLMAFSTS